MLQSISFNVNITGRINTVVAAVMIIMMIMITMMMMKMNYGMVDRRKVLSLISS